MLEQRIEEVTKANLKFYEAFESLDIAKMDEVWAHLEYVTCVHPGWALRSDWPSVRDSWVLIFNNTFSVKFELTEVMVQVAGDMAWVICVENITSQQSDEPQQARGPLVVHPGQGRGGRGRIGREGRPWHVRPRAGLGLTAP